MNRNLIALSATLHIPLQFLEELDDRTIATYWELIEDQQDAMKGGT